MTADLLAMARDWTDLAVVRDAPERVPHVIEQLIAEIERLDAAMIDRLAVQALVGRWFTQAARWRANGQVYEPDIAESFARELAALLVSRPAPAVDQKYSMGGTNDGV